MTSDTALVLAPPTTIGRPSVLTPELTQQVASLVSEGHYIVTACAALGMGRSNYYRWCKQGEADDEANRATPEAAFWHTVKTAEAQGEIKIGRKWQEGGKDWPAYATWNERRRPEHWARRSEASTSVGVIFQKGAGPDDYTVKVAVSASSSPSLLSEST